MSLLYNYIDKVREYYGDFRLVDFEPELLMSNLSPFANALAGSGPDFNQVADLHARAAIAYDEVLAQTQKGNTEAAEKWKITADDRYRKAAKAARDLNLTEIADYIDLQASQRKHYPTAFGHLPTGVGLLKDARVHGNNNAADVLKAIPDPNSQPMQTASSGANADQAIPDPVQPAPDPMQPAPDAAPYAEDPLQAQGAPEALPPGQQPQAALPEAAPELQFETEEAQGEQPALEGQVIEAEPGSFSIIDDEPQALPQKAGEATDVMVPATGADPIILDRGKPDDSSFLPDFSLGPVKDPKPLALATPMLGTDASEVKAALPTGISLGDSGYGGMYGKKKRKKKA